MYKFRTGDQVVLRGAIIGTVLSSYKDVMDREWAEVDFGLDIIEHHLSDDLTLHLPWGVAIQEPPRKCTCGAQFTVNKNLHTSWCDLGDK